MISKSKVPTGTLYIVATPIGNMTDITERAIQVLASVDIIACEDTRHSGKLLQQLGVKKPLLSVHEHNERERVKQLSQRLSQGESIALISDAGTPLISDPGFPLVQGLRELGHRVSPIPGVSAIITALSAAGIATDRFTFEGFLPHKVGGKREKLASLVNEPRTMVFYEAKHRILETIELMAEIFGSTREACVARELTKTFEHFYHGTLPNILAELTSHADHQKGEFVVIIAGNPEPVSDSQMNSHKLLTLLAGELPPKKAAAIVSEITGENKKELYNQLLDLKN